MRNFVELIYNFVSFTSSETRLAKYEIDFREYFFARNLVFMKFMGYPTFFVVGHKLEGFSWSVLI